MIGNCCDQHFEAARSPENLALSFDERRAIHDACADCVAADQRERDRIQQNDTIDPAQPWGAHIALTCRHHRELRWSTKNISFIGARSIFYDSRNRGPECSCSGRDLIVVGI